MKKIVILLFTIFSLTFCNGGKKDTINVGIGTWGGYAAGLTANGGFKTAENSIYDKLGLKVKFIVVEDFEKSRAAFRSGQLQILWGTVDSFSLEYESLKSVNPIVILQNDFSKGGDAIAVTKDIITPLDLADKKIAVAEGTPSHFYILHVLKKSGMDAKSVKWVFTKSAIDAANSFKSGAVDACVSWAPDVYMAAKAVEGGHILSSTKNEDKLIADILMAKKDYIDKNSEKVKKFIKGWFKGVESVKKNPETAIKLMISTKGKGFVGVDAELSKIMLDSVYLPTKDENVKFFDKSNEDTTFYSLFNDSAAIWKSVGLLKTDSDPKKAVMPELLK